MNSININPKILEEYKMKLFKELVKSVWYEEIEKIEEIPIKVLGDSEIDKFDNETIINLMRVIMGLDPTDKFDNSLVEMLNESINLKEINTPIISIIKQACKHCDKNSKEGACLIKNKHSNCNETNTCNACGECISKCSLGAISDKIQFIPMVNLLKEETCPVYAIVAPAFVGQFGTEATPGKLRTALKKVGFEDMIEVALAADMLTAKEAYDYCDHMKNHEDGYYITSCCCPIWVGLIQSSFPEILENVSPSVSPMIACGRAIKILNPNAKVVFIGPCIAKKKEATIEDIKDAIDFVLTFKELEEIFNALEINPSELEEENRVEASYSGRVYARAGGVSKAIQLSAERINKDIKFIPQLFAGVKDCKDGLQKVINKEIDATFIEGMGCVGGCVGGPKRILNVEEGTKNVNEYSENTKIETPFDNLNVLQFLTAMGIKKVESLGEKEEEQILKIFSRDIKNSK
ncbi:[Fe-Fe] hydrogenase large subunit C-terminal domain-containing protein [Faecalimicrobium dakarense]|uniref:[Fe-Fe] hydrogenase large subunit C-terminal domain-containing protein n=1 Tax=Faecalimicrobium dakarense TaxID=1301100 RepID=UPI0004B1A6C2|nr:[Fe-Fe] hydrogenase large subunit C-terminal domain-containing protein [[Clostridium] dakarense]